MAKNGVGFDLTLCSDATRAAPRLTMLMLCTETVAAGRQPRVTANVQDFGQHGSCMDMLSSYRVDSAAGPSGAGAGAGANNADGSGGGGGGSGGGDQLSDMPALFTPTPSAWPPEIVDSMAWSIQFLGAGQPRME